MATWSKLFSFFTWKNRPDTSTPLGQTLLNRLNTALNGIDDRVVALNAQKVSTDEIQGVFTDVRLIKNTGQFVFTLFDGTEKIIDTALEKISINVRFDQATQMMVLEKEDGSIEYVDLSAFTTQFEFVSSPTIQQTVTDGKVRADIKPNSITDQMLQTNYLADITTQANTAVSASQSALESQSLAEQSAEKAEEEADRAEAAADRAESVSAVEIATTSKAGIVKPDGTTITVDADGTIHGNASVTVDTELSTESTNPIANSVVTNAFNEISEKVDYVTPEMFGAIGDGITDDTNAIQRALNIRSNISFKYGATYKVTSTLNVDTDIVNSINGNGATLLFDGDTTLLSIVGHMEVASASPQSIGESNINNGHICIENIKLRSSAFRAGNAIALSKTIFATITNCYITNFNTGIIVSGINRNMIISNNHIYSNNYGIIFDSTVNLHQININSNHIGYGIRNIWFDNATMYNIQICGNDLEIADDYDSDDLTKYCILISASQTEKVSEMEIVGNALQGHGTVTNKNIIRLNYVQDSTIVGNHISNAYEANLLLWGCKGVTISGNEFKGCYSNANIPIVADSGCEYITINGNSMRYCGYVANLVNIRNSVFANNTAQLVNGYERPFIIESTSEVGSKNMIVTGNVINSVTKVTDNYFIKCTGGIVTNNISVNGAVRISSSATDVTNANNYVV